jgi:hypothetical protein
MSTRGKRKPTKMETTKASTDIARISAAIKKGGKLEVRELWMKTEYWLNHIEGGNERITKRIFDKFKK